MVEKEIKEIHKTEFVDKQLPTILFESIEQHDMSHGEQITIQVSDETSESAFQTFKKVRDEVSKQ